MVVFCGQQIQPTNQHKSEKHVFLFSNHERKPYFSVSKNKSKWLCLKMGYPKSSGYHHSQLYRKAIGRFTTTYFQTPPMKYIKLVRSTKISLVISNEVNPRINRPNIGGLWHWVYLIHIPSWLVISSYIP